MTRTDSIWSAVLATEDDHGEGAEAFARDEAGKAAAAGDSQTAMQWETVAGELHRLHSINRQSARAGKSAPPAAGIASSI